MCSCASIALRRSRFCSHIELKPTHAVGINGGQPSTYAYVDADPAGSIDPEGLAACTVLFPDYPIEYAEGKPAHGLVGTVEW